MASLEEERLVQMVHDFIESDSTTPISFSPSNLHQHHESTCLTLQKIVGCFTEEERRVLEIVLKHAKQSGDDGKNSLNKQLMLMLRMEGYDAALCRSCWVATFNCPGGDYEYIDIMMEEKNENGGAERLIVDIDFRSQFEVARPTSAYTELSKTLPSIFVGSEEKLNSIISLVCSAAKESLKERGLHIPPWRKTNYMQSKWLSSSCCQKITTISFPIFSREHVETKKADKSSSKISNWAPPKVSPRRGNMETRIQGAGLSRQFSNLRCPPVA